MESSCGVIDLELTRIFVAVVDRGGFSRAATALRVPKSTVSKAIARLETTLGTRLLARTTRFVAPTAEGATYYRLCAPAIAALDDASRAIADRDSALTGVVRLTAPEDLGAHVISPVIADLAISYPALSFDLRYTDAVLDLVRDEIDLAVRLGPLRDAQLYARKLGESTLIPVAAPSYLRRAAPLRRPEELACHACLSITRHEPSWPLRNGRERVELAVRSTIVCNQMSSLLAMATRGAGVALLPAFLCRGELAEGQLVRVLPGWSRPGLQVSLVSSRPVSSSARIKLVADRLAVAIPQLLAP